MVVFSSHCDGCVVLAIALGAVTPVPLAHSPRKRVRGSAAVVSRRSAHGLMCARLSAATGQTLASLASSGFAELTACGHRLANVWEPDTLQIVHQLFIPSWEDVKLARSGWHPVNTCRLFPAFACRPGDNPSTHRRLLVGLRCSPPPGGRARAAWAHATTCAAASVDHAL
eukprot:3513926-Alexandrium_andersonii.AAC.2